MTTEKITSINGQLISIVTLGKLAARLAFELSEATDGENSRAAEELFTLIQTIHQQTESVQESLEV